MHHMCHHKGHHHCKSLVNNIVKGIILFLIWKIFESIDNRCCGMCESECIRKFKHDLNECYNKIGEVNSLLNESSLVLTDDHRIAMKIVGLEMLNELAIKTASMGAKRTPLSKRLNPKRLLRAAKRQNRESMKKIKDKVRDAKTTSRILAYHVASNSDPLFRGSNIVKNVAAMTSIGVSPSVAAGLAGAKELGGVLSMGLFDAAVSGNLPQGMQKKVDLAVSRGKKAVDDFNTGIDKIKSKIRLSRTIPYGQLPSY